MLPRVCEPPPLDPKLEADVYREMDHGDVNRGFVRDLFESGPVGPRVIDLGCGPALIPITLCETAAAIVEGSRPAVSHGSDLSSLQVMGVDHCVDMLELARVELEFAGMLGQIQLEQVDLNDPDGLQSELAETVISNTVLHHLESPINALRLGIKALRPGGRLFVRDLYRPETDREVERLVELHGGSAEAATSGIDPRQLLRQSLHAALTLEEIREIVATLGIDPGCVNMTSNRHWTLDCVRPERQS
ncbi:class I SAM-dependent methyltransferase [Aporhodopirellula aestuarii]|uniref:Class I SAM-dependent methyltransferase n=1 Tax=Aporhodopirellula aestuarii TaxID=2950107 RepID=A0ABT0U337_9BACT|nr:methyltransferase domain-containing protein [Aporhodopirellula aestuarii]MCM2371223.1 class I SAM-dependent methyltransferase [Aporhodopirellula aestuarii]